MGFWMALSYTFQSFVKMQCDSSRLYSKWRTMSLLIFDMFCFFPIFIFGVGLPRCSFHVLIYCFVFVISVLVKIWTVVGCGH